jgi:hypothetical protein
MSMAQIWGWTQYKIPKLFTTLEHSKSRTATTTPCHHRSAAQMQTADDSHTM